MVYTDLNVSLFNYDELLAEDKYNQFFNPNLCHVCKSPNNGKLIPCNQCYGIYYCSKKHQEMHKASHLPVCQAIELAISHDSNWYTRRCNSEDWIKLQKELEIFIYLNILRGLKSYEKEMCMCAKSCFVCHQRINLHTCTICYSTNYCNDHTINFVTEHILDCQVLLILLNLNILALNKHISYSYPDHLKFYKFRSKIVPFYDMVTFINRYVRRYGESFWNANLYIYSDYMTSPLTLYYACKELNIFHLPRYCDEFIIHIISGSAVDVIGLQGWALFLHLFKNIKKLHIAMIKPEENFKSGQVQHKCYSCVKQNRQMYFENVVESYLDYVNLESYKQPDVIIAFEPVLNVQSVWLESLKTVLVQNCPILLTAKSENQAVVYINIIQTAVGTMRKHILKENKFRSCKPYRDYETGGVYFRNSYFIMSLPI